MKNRVLLGVVAAAVALAGCSGGEARESEAAAREVEVVLAPTDVAVAERETVDVGVVLSGTLRPYREVEVRAQVPGLLANLRVDRGQAVRAGEAMAFIEADGLRSQAAGAQAAVAAAQSNVALARRQLESARMLFEAGALSEIELRGAESSYRAAEAQLAAARAQAAGAAETARRTTVTAPITGEVSVRSASEGEAVGPGQALFTVVNTEVLELAGRVPVEEAAGVRPGQSVEFRLDAYPGRSFRGSVARVEPTADPATRQVGVYVQLPNRDRALVGGLFATGRVLTGGKREAVVVPAAAVRGGGAGAYVRVVEGGAVRRQAVAVGARDERRGTIEIVTGLSGGEQVIAVPGDVAEGTRVRVGASAAPSSSSEGQ